MKDFMHEYAGELPRVGGQLRVECDASFADKRAGVYGTVPVGERAADFKPHRVAVDGWEATRTSACATLTRSH